MVLALFSIICSFMVGLLWFFWISLLCIKFLMELSFSWLAISFSHLFSLSFLSMQMHAGLLKVLFFFFLQVYRNRKWRPISSDEIIPGDIVSIGNGLHDGCNQILV